MTEEAKAARREYAKAWYSRNKDRCKQYRERYWRRVAEAEKRQGEETQETEN